MDFDPIVVVDDAPAFLTVGEGLGPETLYVRARGHTKRHHLHQRGAKLQSVGRRNRRGSQMRGAILPRRVVQILVNSRNKLNTSRKYVQRNEELPQTDQQEPENTHIGSSRGRKE